MTRTGRHDLSSEGDLFDELRAALRTQGEDPSERVPSRFTDLRLLSRGGQGTVYRAFDRRRGVEVALKLLRRTDDPREGARLEREVEFLRRIEHEGVVRVLDGGVEEGVRFLAMELVDGEPLDRFVERCAPPLRVRLELAAAIADAVDAAHRHGVLHRDLKPRNVLVDREGRPKVLDFGIARSLRLHGATPGFADSTSGPGFFGTLAYASPELLQGDGSTTDTRSDVYSLGVLVYELLTKSLPYPAQGSDFEVQRAILEVPPTDPRRFVPRLPRDVATILLRSLAKDPERRTPSARAFADDLRRVLAHRPIEARRDHLGAVIGQWFRRHPGLAAGTGLALLGVVLAGTALLRAQWQTSRQRHTSEQIRAVFQDLLAAATPQGMRQRIGLLEVFEDVARRAEAELADAPDAQAAVQLSLGETYLRLLLVDEALPHLRAAVERYREHDRSDHLQLARALEGMGQALTQRSQVEAVAVQREALAIHRSELGDGDPRVARSQRALADAISSAYPPLTTAPESPGELLASALDTFVAAFGEDHLEVASTHLLAAQCAWKLGDREDAEQHLARARAIHSRIEVEDEERIAALDLSARLLRAQGRFDEASEALGQAFEHARRLDEHVRVALLRSLANLHFDRGDDTTSERCSREALALELESWEARRPDRASACQAAAEALRAATAVPPFAEAFAELKALRGPGAYEVADWMIGVAVLERRLDRGELAETLLRSALEIGCRSFGTDCPVRVRALEQLAACCEESGRLADARALLEEAVATRERAGTLDGDAGREALARLQRCEERGSEP